MAYIIQFSQQLSKGRVVISIPTLQMRKWGTKRGSCCVRVTQEVNERSKILQPSHPASKPLLVQRNDYVLWGSWPEPGEWQHAEARRWREGEKKVERTNVEYRPKDPLWEERMEEWLEGEEWQKLFVFLMSKSGGCGPNRFCLHHTPELLRKNQRVGWKDMQVPSNTDSTTLQLRNSCSGEPDRRLHLIKW
jgi:hypothetical protein